MPSVCRCLSIIYTDFDSENNQVIQHFLIESPAFDITIHNISGKTVFIYQADQKDRDIQVPLYLVDPGTSCNLLKSHLHDVIFSCFSINPYFASY